MNALHTPKLSVPFPNEARIGDLGERRFVDATRFVGHDVDVALDEIGLPPSTHEVATCGKMNASPFRLARKFGNDAAFCAARHQ
jgi:hypothetical protein